MLGGFAAFAAFDFVAIDEVQILEVLASKPRLFFLLKFRK